MKTQLFISMLFFSSVSLLQAADSYSFLLQDSSSSNDLVVIVVPQQQEVASDQKGKGKAITATTIVCSKNSEEIKFDADILKHIGKPMSQRFKREEDYLSERVNSLFFNLEMHQICLLIDALEKSDEKQATDFMDTLETNQIVWLTECADHWDIKHIKDVYAKRLNRFYINNVSVDIEIPTLSAVLMACVKAVRRALS